MGHSTKLTFCRPHMCNYDRHIFLCRWRLKMPRDEHHLIIKNAVEDSYKRLIQPFLSRSYRYIWCSSYVSRMFISFYSSHWPKVRCVHHRLPPSFLFHVFLQSSVLLCFFLASRTKLTSAAEKESIAMFVRNLRQRLLAGPVRGSVIMGVDPGYKHGCKLAILSPTSKSPQTKANIIFCCALFIYLTKETNTFSLSYRKLISGYCRCLPVEVWSLLCRFFSWHFYFFNLRDFQVRFCIQIFFTFGLQVNKEKQKSCVILWANTGTNAGGGYLRAQTRVFFFKLTVFYLLCP